MQTTQSPEAALAQARERLRVRDMPGAAALLEAALVISPQSAEVALLLGAVRAEQGEFGSALAHLDHAFRLQPGQSPGPRLLYARVLLDAGRLEDAMAAYRACAEADPADPRGRVGEAHAAWRLARGAGLERSIELLRRSVDLDPANADAWNELGNALTNAALLDAARAAYREALKARPGYHQVESNLLIAMHYDPEVRAGEIFEAHRDWARRHAAGIEPLVLPPREKRAQLRIGLLSPAFTPGPTAHFLAPLVRHLDRERFELFAYNVGPAEGIDPALAADIAHWRHAAADDDEALALRIAADGIDVLVDLAGHTPGGRLLVVARRPARVVVEWLDYFDTSGLPGVEIIVGDPVSTPPDSPQRFTEEVARIEPCRFCYAPPPYAPPVAPTPALSNGFVTFGSFNRLSKMPPPVVALWARVLQAVPGSRLLLKNTALGDAGTRASFARVLEGHGIAPARFELRGPTDHESMLAEYGGIDIALDTFPYNGGLTTCEALWMGVPVLAQMGEAMISRQSASMLHAAGMGDWVASGGEDYVRRAAAFAAAPGELARTRAARRAMLAASPLMDGARFARGFAAILERAGNDDAE